MIVFVGKRLNEFDGDGVPDDEVVSDDEEVLNGVPVLETVDVRAHDEE